MARFLQRLLAINEPTFSIGIRELEKATGLKGVDTRLIADVTHKAHAVMRRLGLDTSASTAKEVYRSLINSVRSGEAETLLLDNDYVLMSFDDEVVSFNLIDVIENFHYEFKFEDRIISHGQRSLRGEIVHRYIDSGNSNEAITRHLAIESGLITESDEEYYEQSLDQSEINSQPYILAIGDIVSDAFITLEKSEAEVTTDKSGRRILSMEFGSKLPYEKVDVIKAVGNSANAAVAFARLGLRSGLMTYLGDDQAGRESLTYLSSQKVDTHTVSVQTGMKTNYHFALKYDDDRTILIKYEDYDYSWQEPAQVPNWIYLSMLSESSWELHEDLLGYLERHPDIKLAFQPGVFHFKWGKAKLTDVYKRSCIVVMNKEEAQDLVGDSGESMTGLLKSVSKLGPEIVVVTDGVNGSYVMNDGKAYKMPNYPDPAKPYDRTGAGDAFASTLVAALAIGKSIETAITWAPINSMSVVQKLGAQEGLLSQSEIERYLEKAPDYFKMEEIKD